LAQPEGVSSLSDGKIPNLPTNTTHTYQPSLNFLINDDLPKEKSNRFCKRIQAKCQKLRSTIIPPKSGKKNMPSIQSK